MSTLPIQSYRPTQGATKVQDEKLREVSELYEKQFLREMVKAMRSTVQHGGLTEPSMAENIFREKLDHEYVESWGSNGGIGLADIIYNQLNDRFGSGMKLFPPQGPVPVDKDTLFKIDETRPMGIPVVPNETGDPAKDLSYQIQTKGGSDIRTPWDGRVLQSFATEDGRQTVKIEHDNGLVSTLHFAGRNKGVQSGDLLSKGDALGVTDPDVSHVTWRIVEVQKQESVG